MISTPSSTTGIATTSNPPTAVLFSGGLDSSILTSHLLQAGVPVQPLYIRSGLRWEAAELAAAKDYLQAIQTADLRELVILNVPVGDLYGNHWSLTAGSVPDAQSADTEVHLPGRNALLVVKSAIWCKLNQIPRLALAALGTSPFADAGADFFAPLQTALNCGDESPLRLSRPFATRDKRAVMRLGQQLPLDRTFSCLAPSGRRHCGRCNKCAERQVAFRSVESPDPTPYAQAPALTVPAI